MAINRSAQMITGLSTDVKPTDVPTGIPFFETDTANIFRWNGSTWIFQLLASSTTGIGYATGSGGVVTQATSKSTSVTLNKLCGKITMNGAALAAATIVTFTVTNSVVSATDIIITQHDSVGTIGGYTVTANTPAAGSFQIAVRNNTAASLSEAIVLRFAILKTAIASIITGLFL